MVQCYLLLDMPTKEQLISALKDQPDILVVFPPQKQGGAKQTLDGETVEAFSYEMFVDYGGSVANNQRYQLTEITKVDGSKDARWNRNPGASIYSDYEKNVAAHLLAKYGEMPPPVERMSNTNRKFTILTIFPPDPDNPELLDQKDIIVYSVGGALVSKDLKEPFRQSV